MAQQLYGNTQLATALFEVLQDLVLDGKVPEPLAVATLAQLDRSLLTALKEEVPAKAEIRGNLDTYKYYDNVWQFKLSDVAIKVNPTGTGSMKKVPTVECKKMALTCVDVQLQDGNLR